MYCPLAITSLREITNVSGLSYSEILFFSEKFSDELSWGYMTYTQSVMITRARCD